MAVAHMIPEGMVSSIASGTRRYGMAAACMPPLDLCAYADYLDAPAFLRRQAEEPEVEAKPAREPLSPERVAKIRQALRMALDEILLSEGSMRFSASVLMDLIDSSLHDDVHQYLEDSSIELWTAEDACRLLEELAEGGVGAELTDDQEARLAVWRHEVV